MAEALEHSRTGLWSGQAISSVTRWVQGIFGRADFTPEQSLADTPDIDRRLVPRVPMSNADIDVHLLNELSKLGLKRGKLVTDQSHPELMQVWHEMSRRAGLKTPPQLILAESKAANALTVSHEEVVITTGLLKTLDLRELSAVLGHELAHGTSDHKRPRMEAMAVLGTVGAVAGHKVGQNLLRSQQSGSVVVRALHELVYIGLGSSLGLVAANHVAVRPTEQEADRKGATISGDPKGLANALRKIQGEPGKQTVMGWLAHMQSGYPSTSGRIANLEKIAATMPYATPAIAVLDTTPPTLPVADVRPGHAVSAIAVESRLEVPAAAPHHGLG